MSRFFVGRSGTTSPFNQGTSAQFALTHGGPVRRRKDDAGRRGVASGVYVVRLDADLESFAWKITLMK